MRCFRLLRARERFAVTTFSFTRREEGSMSNQDKRPVKVIALERRHPAIRLVARACIELARQRLAKRRAAGRQQIAPPRRDQLNEGDARG